VPYILIGVGTVRHEDLKETGRKEWKKKNERKRSSPVW